MCQGVLNFPFSPMQLKHAHNMYSIINELLLNPKDILNQPGKQTLIHSKSQLHTENEVTGIKESSPKLEYSNDLIICPALTTTHGKHYTRLTDHFLKHPFTLKKETISLLSQYSHQNKQNISNQSTQLRCLRHLLDTKPR